MGVRTHVDLMVAVGSTPRLSTPRLSIIMVMADGGSMEGCLISGEAWVEGLGAWLCGGLGAGAGTAFGDR